MKKRQCFLSFPLSPLLPLPPPLSFSLSFSFPLCLYLYPPSPSPLCTSPPSPSVYLTLLPYIPPPPSLLLSTSLSSPSVPPFSFLMSSFLSPSPSLLFSISPPPPPPPPLLQGVQSSRDKGRRNTHTSEGDTEGREGQGEQMKQNSVESAVMSKHQMKKAMKKVSFCFNLSLPEYWCICAYHSGISTHWDGLFCRL